MRIKSLDVENIHDGRAVSSKGQIVLPAELRQQDGIRPGQELDVERVDQGEYLLNRRSRRRNDGLVRLLLVCPAKGWFKAQERTETTDDLAVPKLGWPTWLTPTCSASRMA